MNILLLNPPFLPKYSRSQRSPAVIKSGVLYYPIWLAYATGVLEHSGFRTQLVDAPAAGYDLPTVLGLAEAHAPRLVVIESSTPSIENDVAVAADIKARLPRAFVVLVGTHVSALPTASLNMQPAVDAVARGEYDYTLRELAYALQDGMAVDLQSVLGLSYRTPHGEIKHNAARPFIQDLDALPFVSAVYRRYLRIEDYFYSITRYPEVAILTGRGCPFQCTYCVWPQTLTGHQYRRRSAANVADEFEFIARELPQVKEVFVEDDTLTASPQHAQALAQALIQRHNRLPFSANTRADADYETLHQLHQAGLRLVCVGFESGDQQVLDHIRKGIKVEQFYRFRQAARRAKVLVHGCFMAGNPGETAASLDKTLALAKRLNPDTAQFFPLMVYPGTTAYDWMKQNGYLSTEHFPDWLTAEGLHRSTVYLPTLPPAALTDWCDNARRSFYLRPRYILAKLWQILTQPSEALRILRAGKTFAKYLLRF